MHANQPQRTLRHRTAAAVLAATAGVLSLAGAARAGGSPENVLVIIDPGSSESMYLGNYYKNARNIPDANVLYVNPAPAAFSDFTGANGDLNALLGQLKNARIDDHIDYIVVAAGGSFYVSAPGYVIDGCSPVTRFSQSAIYTMAYIAPQILGGNIQVGLGNQYYSSGAAIAFNSRTSWLGGTASTNANAKRYFVTAQLGYTGSLGNTVPEVLAMIDSSVGADGTRPAGTFYFMNTTDSARNVRAPQFPAAMNSIIANGGLAQTISDVLPDGHTDGLGVMTGWADPAVDTDNAYAILPGSFGDHLTSWAATFDIGQQTKLSAWIRKGAAGSSGEVEEPCNYTGKFITANFHAIYFQGLSLGEAWLRSSAYVPFQGLLVGDPMCRPFARFPTVVGNAPTGTLSGLVQFTPTASTPISGASITALDLFVDGVFHSRHTPGQMFTINTVAIPEGYHELRLLAYDSTGVKNTGRWTGSFSSTVTGRSVTITPPASSGTMSTLFQVGATATNGSAREMRLLQNGRVIAATNSSPASFQVYGRNFGAGQCRLQVESLYTDGTVARSAPFSVNVAYSAGSPSGQAPVAYNFTKTVTPGTTFAVELPARFDDDPAGAAYALISPPAIASIGIPGKGYVIMTAPAGSCGPDSFTYRVTTPSGQSNVATVTLIYANSYACLADVDGDGVATVGDFTAFLQAFATNNIRADIDGTCVLNVADFTAFLQAFAKGCP